MRWIVVCVLVLLFIIVPFVAFGEKIDAAVLDNLSKEQSIFWTAAFIAAILSLDIVLPIPSSSVAIASGALLGPWVGTATIWFGMTVASTLGYWLGAGLNRLSLDKFVGAESLEKVTAISERFGFAAIAICRPIPVLAETSTVMAGMSRMPLVPYMLTTTLCNLAISIAYGLAGALAMKTDSLAVVLIASIAVPLPAWFAYRQLSRKRA